jgi:hypothetical protein
MTTRIIEAYDVSRWDGGDRTNHYCFMSNEKDAKEVAGEHGHYVKRDFVVHESIADLQHWNSGELKRQALAKLTPAEKIALGLN